jgi:hypothetical protein
VETALNRVIDPCSLARHVAAGIVDMRMVLSVESRVDDRY